MAFATVAELELFTGRPAPGGAERMLERASVTVASALRWGVETSVEGLPLADDSVASNAVRDATCATVEYWGLTSENVDKADQSEESGSAASWLAPRAERILAIAGLRNASVRVIN